MLNHEDTSLLDLPEDYPSNEAFLQTVGITIMVSVLFGFMHKVMMDSLQPPFSANMHLVNPITFWHSVRVLAYGSIHIAHFPSKSWDVKLERSWPPSMILH